MNPIYSISISAQVVLDMHSLNNEGGEGNQIQTRMVNVVGNDRRLHNVNAISGDMFKHIHAEHLHRLAMKDALALSAGARSFNANRINYDIEVDNDIAKAMNKAGNDPAKLDVLLKSCTVTDLEGILVTAAGMSLPRKSVVEFGWVVGLPNSVETDSYFHVKYVADRSSGARAKSDTDEGRERNTGQAIFHRPASSGIYALVLNIEVARIGYNDLAQRYAIDAAERAKRMKVLLESVLHTLIEPAGAMRSTQNPHLLDLAGAVTISRDVVPAPAISPLKPTFVEEIEKTAEALNLLRPSAVEVKRFEGVGQFSQILAELVKKGVPMELTVA